MCVLECNQSMSPPLRYAGAGVLDFLQAKPSALEGGRGGYLALLLSDGDQHLISIYGSLICAFDYGKGISGDFRAHRAAAIVKASFAVLGVFLLEEGTQHSSEIRSYEVRCRLLSLSIASRFG
jgi:hypothetical protein